MEPMEQLEAKLQALLAAVEPGDRERVRSALVHWDAVAKPLHGLGELEREFKALFQTSKEDGGYLGHADAFQRITEEMGALKEKKAFILAQQEGNSAASRRIRDAVDILEAGDPRFTEWNESDIRQLVDTVVVLSKLLRYD